MSWAFKMKTMLFSEVLTAAIVEEDVTVTAKDEFSSGMPLSTTETANVNRAD